MAFRELIAFIKHVCGDTGPISLYRAHGDGSSAHLMTQLLHTDLLILDYWDMQKVTAAQRQELIEMIEDQHGLRSTLSASQLPRVHWHEQIGEATIADVVLDRLLHGAHRLALSCDSMRRAAAASLTDCDYSE